MRKVDRTLITKPVILDSTGCLDHLNQINIDPTTNKASGDIYKGKTVMPDNSIINTVTNALKGLYKNKCAYCEKLCYYPRIEHYRPKGRVIGNQRLRNGYYWLCYEWTNLLPSCHECNSIEAKGDKFPINGVRKQTFPVNGHPPAFDITQNVYDSTFLMDEDPYYIHPEYCNDFWVHFDFERSGLIVGISDYGKITINDLKLNDEDRNGWRREIYETYYNRFLRLIRRYKRPLKPISEQIFNEELDDIISELVFDSINEELSYTLFRKSLVRKINYFFVEPLDVVFRKEIEAKIANSLIMLAN